MLKIYTDQHFITPKNRRCVFPLLFDLCYTKNQQLLSKYELVTKIEDAVVVIVPLDISEYFQKKQEKWLFEYIDKALALHKKVWVYTAGDYGLTLKKEVYTFRLSGFNSKFDTNTFILPSFIEDPYAIIQNKFHPIAKEALPKIGFVGHASNSGSKWVKEVLVFLLHNYKRLVKVLFTDYQSFYPSSIKRYKYLSLLQKNNHIETDFVFRNQYRAGAKTTEDKQKTTQDFFENLATNPYTFCLRGAGNYSVRFYETLAMGRIPFVIATDFRLPLDGIVNWKEHCVLAADANICEALIDFHKKISDEDFEKMQVNNRNLWLQFLNRETYFITLSTLFKEKI
ncbi:hypothetical protein QLS31_04945 [Flavobacterium sp. XS2P24]|uniref:hypothetical protein n=1 Tax=Flavobacterium sp. XS2P24 TaxID=3041249 RepID=UPI0024A94D4A|nr:hypothetical protein [Flavobacterium sp. XS2P24]MDI6049167.1 hypothetical protein [Flavobacterium sp. XS2P24]